MATDSKTPTPSRDVDVFGKGLGLTGKLLHPECACVRVDVQQVMRVCMHGVRLQDYGQLCW